MDIYDAIYTLRAMRPAEKNGPVPENSLERAGRSDPRTERRQPAAGLIVVTDPEKKRRSASGTWRPGTRRTPCRASRCDDSPTGDEPRRSTRPITWRTTSPT